MSLNKCCFWLLLLGLFVTKASAQNCTLSATVSSSSPAVCSGSVVVLTANATGGTAPYSYKWNTGDTTQSINITAEGTYTVAVTDNTPGCGPVTFDFSISKANFLKVADVTICANTQATLTASGADTYQWYDAPSNGTLVSQDAKFVTPVLTGTTTYYLIAINNGCQSDVTPVTANVLPAADPPVVANAAICSGSRATLSVTSPGSLFDWYTTPTGGNSLITSRDFTTPVLTAASAATTTTYYVQGYNGSCPGPRTAVTVTVNPLPQTPAAAGVTVCYNATATLTVSNAASINGTINWYTDSFSNSLVATGATYTPDPLKASKTFYVQTVSPEGCTSGRVPVIVTVKAQVPHPTVSGTVVCRGNAATLTALSIQSGTTFQWFDADNNLKSNSATFITSPLTANTSYYVQGTYQGCTSPLTQVDVIVTDPPEAPTVSGTTTICPGGMASLTATGSTGKYQWYNAATGGMLLSSDPTFTPSPAANTTYYVQAIDGQCPGARTPVMVNVNTTPPPPTVNPAAVSICPGTTTTLNANATGAVVWFDAPAGGNVVAIGNTFTTPVLNSSTTYYAENDLSTSQCGSSRTAAVVTVYTVPDPILTYPRGTYCKTIGGTATPTINPMLQPTPASKSFSGDLGLVINPTTGVVNIALSTIGAHTVTVTFTGNPCVQSATAVINITINGGDPTFSYAGPYCQYAPNGTAKPIYALGAGGGLFTATPAGLVFVNNSNGEIDLINSRPGIYTVTNSISCGGNVSSSTSVTINATPRVNAGPDQFLSINSPVYLAGTSEQATPNIRWTTTGAGTFDDATKLKAVYTPALGETMVPFTLTSIPAANQCTSTDNMVVNFSPLGATTVSGGRTVCAGESATLTAANSTTSGSFQWLNSGGNIIYTGNPYVVTPAVTTKYYVQFVSNGVTSNRDSVIVMVSPVPDVTVNGGTICFDSQAILQASVASPTSADIFNWYDNNNVLLATAPVYTTTYLQQSTTYFVQYINSSLPCPGPKVPVTINVNPLPTITSPITASVCTNTAFSYNITGTGTTYTWSRAADTENAVANGTGNIISETLINTSNVPINVTYVIIASNNGCSAPPFNLVVTIIPNITVTSSLAASVCNSTPLNYELKLNFTPASVTWSRAKVAGITNAAILNQSAPVIRELLNNNTTAPVDVKYVYNVTSGCGTSIINLIVTVEPTIKVNSATSGAICSGDAFTYNITSPTNTDPAKPLVTFTWVRQTQAGISSASAATGSGSVISETLINTGLKPANAAYKITPSINGCQGGVFTYTVTVNPIPPTPAINALSAVCTGSVLALSTKAVSGATYSWTGPNNFTSNSRTPNITNVTKANAGTYTLIISVAGCISPAGKFDVGVDIQPVAVAGPNQNVCINDVIQLNGQVNGGSANGVWSSGGGGTFSPSASQLNAVYMPSAADMAAGKVILTLSSAPLDNCSISTSQLTVTFIPLPVVNAGGNQDVCNQNTSVKLNGIVSSNAVNIYWTTDGTGTFSPSASVVNPSYIMSSSDIKRGFVNLALTAANITCNATDKVVINFIPPPVITFGTKLFYLIRNTKKVLEPQVDKSDVQYLWTPALYLDDSKIKNPTLTATADETYKLTVTDKLGCVAADELQIIVLDPIVTYNAFSPNSDGVNDTWVVPALSKYPGATVDIYNRYGTPLFHSNGYSVPWDGTYNGQLVPFGVYYYVIRTKFSDQIFSGYITVVR